MEGIWGLQKGKGDVMDTTLVTDREQYHSCTALPDNFSASEICLCLFVPQGLSSITLLSPHKPIHDNNKYNDSIYSRHIIHICPECQRLRVQNLDIQYPRVSRLTSSANGFDRRE